MYCGMSLGRVGLDFRGLLVPVFEQEVLRLFSTSVKVGTLCVQRSGAQIDFNPSPTPEGCWCQSR